MDRTPAPVSLATARGLRPPEVSRAAEVFRDDHVWIRFAARPTSGPQVPHGRDEFYIVASGTARYRWDGGDYHDRTGRHDVRGCAHAARL
jgi:mannose-6-phosphate isomerase-like protein (cupin superfamily)